VTNRKDRNLMAQTLTLIIEQAVALAVENLHLTACRIEKNLPANDTSKERLAHIEIMTTLIASHAPADVRALIPCVDCRRALAAKIPKLTIQ
jgi:hypothetical protein